MTARRLPDHKAKRLSSALSELQELIREHYPAATFEVARGQDDPEAIHLYAFVDVEDTTRVLDVAVDRMMDIQIEDGLPIFIIPMRPIHGL